MVLLAVMVVVVILSLAAYQYSDLMMAEYKAADSAIHAEQARLCAESGVHYAAAVLSNSDALANLLNGNPFDNPQVFQDQIVQSSDLPRSQGRFSIVAPADPNNGSADSRAYRFGVRDESARINLNALMRLDRSGKAAHDMLMKLPNMTEEIANAIVDWLDADDQPRNGGAENETYSLMNPPYRCKNGPLDSIEELLLVKGVTPQLLFGNDRNRNGMPETNESDAGGQFDPGWSAYLTIYSREQNVDAEGQPRINVNDRNLLSLAQKLTPAVGEDLARYLLLCRIYGLTSTSTKGQAKGGPPAATAPLASLDMMKFMTDLDNAMKQKKTKTISSLYDVVNSQVSVPSADPERPPTVYQSPLNRRAALKQRLPLLLDKLTTSGKSEIPGRVNINTAPEEVLSALPKLTTNDVQLILAQRPQPSAAAQADPIFQTPAWLLTEANLKVDTLKQLEPYITTRTQVYRVQSVGYFDGGGPTARIEAVIDTNNGRPRILCWRDLSELGKGFDLSVAP